MFSIFSSLSTDSFAYKVDKRRGLARLYTEEVPPSDHRFYSTLLCHFTSSTHAFDTFSVRDARHIRDNQPRNFKTLVELLTLHLESLKKDELFASETAQGSAGQSFAALGKWVAAPLLPFTSAFGGSSQSDDAQPRDRIREALNCARLLTRLVPVLMEAPLPADAGVAPYQNFTSTFEEDVLWSRNAPLQGTLVGDVKSGDPPAAKKESLAEDHFVIEDEDEPTAQPVVADHKEAPPFTSSEAAQAPIPDSIATLGPALAERIIALCIDYLFFPGFSLPHLPEDDDTGSPDDSRVHFAIWQKGVGSSLDLPETSHEHIAHRIDFLRLLLVMLSKSVFVPPNAQQGFTDRALQFACTSLSRTVTLPVLCSLLNTVCNTDQGNSWSLPGFVGQQETEGKEALRAIALQTLAVVLSWSPEANDGVGRTSSGQTPSETSLAGSAADGGNQFAYWISKIHRASDLDMISSSLFALLRPGTGSIVPLPLVNATSSLNISNQKGICNRSPEALTLLWQLLKLNSKFRAHILDDSRRAPLLLGILLSQALLGKDSPQLHGLVRLSLFILQDISSDQCFAKHLAAANSAGECKLPLKFVALANGASSAADVLIAASYSLLTNRGLGSSGLGVHPVILITLANCSPYFVSLTIPSSTRLSLLLAQFSNAAFLLADEGHPRSLYFLLEAINSLLIYQAASNRNALYALLLKSKEVERLQNFTLRKGIAEIRRKTGLARVGSTPSLGSTSPAPTSTSAVAAQEASRSGATDPLSTSTLTAEEKAQFAGKDDPDASIADIPSEVAQPARVPSEKALGKARRISTSSSSNKADASPGNSNVGCVTDSAGVEQKFASGNVGSQSDQSDLADEWVSRLDDGELWEAASRVGKNGFVPTEEWVQSWVEGLPLDPLKRLCTHLLPQIETLGAASVEGITTWLHSQDLSPIFPSPPPSSKFFPRPFQWTIQVKIWWHSFIWGSIYISHTSLAIFPPEGIRLFHLIVPPTATSTVSRRKDEVEATASTTTPGLAPAGNVGDGQVTKAGKREGGQEEEISISI